MPSVRSHCEFRADCDESLKEDPLSTYAFSQPFFLLLTQITCSFNTNFIHVESSTFTQILFKINKTKKSTLQTF